MLRPRLGFPSACHATLHLPPATLSTLKSLGRPSANGAGVSPDLLPKLGTHASAGYTMEPTLRQLQVRPLPLPRLAQGRYTALLQAVLILCIWHPGRGLNLPLHACSPLAPTIHSLPRTTLPKSMAASDPESLAAVDGFTLSHRGVGSLRWLVPVDVRGLELDKIAHIQQGEGRATGLLGGMQKQASKQLPHASSHRPRRCLAAPPHPCDPPHPFPIPCNPPLTAPR
jgi:hypothetical protein